MITLSSRSVRLLQWTAIALLAAGCQGEPETWAGTGQCVRDPALIEQLVQTGSAGTYQARCVADDSCPCGMHCDLGVCATACRVDGDCAEGTVCDSFGRCAGPAQANRAVAVSGEARGAMLVDRAQLDLHASGSVEPVQVLARVLDLSEVRAVAEAGLEVSCDGGASFGRDCRFGPVLTTEVPKRIQVRAAGEWPATDVRAAVYFNAPGQSFAVGVLKRGAPPPEPQVRHGIYEGKARLVGAGLKARSALDEPLPDELARLELPITAEVFPETGGVYSVRFTDPRHTVFPPDASGALSYNNVSGAWELTMASRQYLGRDVDNPDASELDLHVKGTVTDGTFSQGLLQGELVSLFEGLSPEGLAPFARWKISLTRVRSLPASATPPSLEARPVANTAARASTPFADEALAEASIAGLAGFTATTRAISTLCSTAGGGALKDVFTGTTYGNGDLLCEGGSAPLAFGVEAGKLSERGAFLDSCVAALDLSSPAAWDAVTGPGDCAVRTRAVAAAAFALENDRLRAFGAGSPADLGATRLAQRVLQQWMAGQSLVALEPRRLFRVGSLLPGGPALDRLRHYAQPGQVFASIQRSISGWDFLLHPRIGSGLMNAPPQALVAPDYRVAFAPGTFPAGEQNLGLPITLLTTLTRQLEGLDGLIDDLTHYRVLGTERAEVAEELSRFLPRNVVLFAIATGLHDAARSQAVPGWRPQWENAKRLYGSAAAKLVDQIYLLESGRNPLGIEEEDLPLYRLGDQQGTTRRFSAVSDSLLGREDLLDPAIAPTLIDRARSAELLARDSVSALLERELVQNLQATETDFRLEQVHRFYGEQITSFCGNYDSLTVLDRPDGVDADTCFLADSCTFSVEEYNARMSTADLGYQVCLASKLRERFGDAVTTGQAELDRQLSLIAPSFAASTPFFDISMAQNMLDGFSAGYQGVSPPNIKLPEGVDQETVRQVEALCESARVLTEGARPSANPTNCARTDDCAIGNVCDTRSGVCQPEGTEVDPTCFLGSLGETAVAIRAAATDVDIARAELEELSERYDNAMRGCLILQQGHDAVEGAMRAHNNTMAELAQAKFAADTAAQVAEKAANLFSLDKIWKAVGTAIFGAIQQAAESTAGTLQLRMDNVERQHELTLAALENVTEERLCFNEAEAELVGARSAGLRVKRQSEELGLLIVRFNAMKASTTALMADGITSLETERERAVSPANVDHWLDQNVDLYDQRMRRARRAMYLAVLAVEYEFQFSSNERAQVLAAQTPTLLEDSLNRLRDFVRRGAPPGGGNPTQLLAVLSLRKNLMQVSDRSKHADGAHTLGEVERFRRLLLSPRYAVYDSRGVYAGQEIPFSLQPLGSLGLADTGAVPLLSGLSCAERLWSVNATVQGEGLMQGTDTSIATLQIRKRNTFSSQWCGGASGGEQQVASTRPSQNLFVDPFSASTWGQDDLVSVLTNTREDAAFSWATVQARLNVDRRQLEQVSYLDGHSTALAGRGVFGDYTLFIPATTQSIASSVGLLLQKVDDVLIRFEYVAAERQ